MKSRPGIRVSKRRQIRCVGHRMEKITITKMRDQKERFPLTVQIRIPDKEEAEELIAILEKSFPEWETRIAFWGLSKEAGTELEWCHLISFLKGEEL